MKKAFKFLIKSAAYCIAYMVLINCSASAINKTLDTLNFKELTSIDAMRSGQKDVFVYLKHIYEDVDVNEIRNTVLSEIETLQNK